MLYWAPDPGFKTGPQHAEIAFTIHRETGDLNGVLTLARTGGQTGTIAAVYTATLTQGADIHLSQAVETDGGVLSLADNTK